MCGHKLFQALGSSSLLFAFAFQSLIAESPARQQLDKVTAATSLDREGIQPWHMRLSFDLFDQNDKPEESGTLEEWWAGPDRARVVISSPSFNQVLPGGNGALQGREAYLVHLLLNSLVHPVPKLGDPDKLISSVRSRTFGQVTLSCATLSQSRDDETPPEYCTDTNGDVRLVMTDGVRSEALNDIQSIMNSRVAMKQTIAYVGHAAIRGHIDLIEPFDPDHSGLQLGRLAPVVDKTVTPAHLLIRVQPIYPEAGRYSQAGMVVLHMRILADGKHGAIDTVASTGFSFTQASLDAIGQWRYTPMRQNGVATECDAMITITFSPANHNRDVPHVLISEYNSP